MGRYVRKKDSEGVRMNFAGGIVGAIVGGVLGTASGIHTVRQTQKGMKNSYIQQMKVLMKNYNYNQNALTQEERYALDGAKSELYSISLNGIQNNAQVEAALGETGTEGRTSGQISRAISGQTERRRTGVIDNYYQNMDQLRSQKDVLYIQTKDTVDQAERNFNDAQTSDLYNLLYVHNSMVQGSKDGFIVGMSMGGGASGGEGGGSMGSFDFSSLFGSMGSSASKSGSSMFSSMGSSGSSWGGTLSSMFSNSGSSGGSMGGSYGSTINSANNLIGMAMNLFDNSRSKIRYNWIY